jgi:hypothetical protein
MGKGFRVWEHTRGRNVTARCDSLQAQAASISGRARIRANPGPKTKGRNISKNPHNTKKIGATANMKINFNSITKKNLLHDL